MGQVKENFIDEWIELSEAYGENPNGPRVLPIEKIGETYYFRDDRLRQLRNVRDASDQLQFETDGDLLVFVMQHR